MELISGLVGILIFIAVLNDFVGMRKELKQLNQKNEKIIELLEDIKKGSERK